MAEPVVTQEKINRINELARIMGGDNITPALLETAREMVKQSV